MAKSNRQYWVERAQHRELISYTNGLDVTAFLANEYKKCAVRVRKDINDFYSRYANDYGLTYEQAVREMSRPELMEWRGTVEDYINEIANEKNPVVKERLMREYDALSYNSRISRLDGLCGNIQMNVDRLYSRAVNQLTGFLGEEFKGSYYRTMYDLQTVNGFSSNFSTINAELVEKTLAYPWSGANFSDRLWKNKNALIDTIRETLTQGMIRGDNIRDMSKAIAEKLGSSLKNAERVVRTETSHIHNTSEIEAYKAGGYEEYEYMASFGEKTCEVCGGLDGQHFKLSDIQYGVNFPPVHPNCRCTTVCWDEADEEQKALEGQKALDYEEWYQKYVEGREQPKLESKDGAAVEVPRQPTSPAPVIAKPVEIDAEILTTGGDSGIINADEKGTAVSDVHYIGKIDLNIFKCVTEDIITDEVILTDERMGHIIDRRGQEFYDKFQGLFGTILSDPDFIFKDDSPNTAIVCKQFVEHEKTVNIVLRLAVEGDNPKYKNSILTAIGENNKRFKQRLRNNIPIYVKKNLDKTE